MITICWVFYVFVFFGVTQGSVEITSSSIKQDPDPFVILLISKSQNELDYYKKILRAGMISNFDHSRQERKKLQEKQLLESQQARKRKEILEFLSQNYMSTNYFYDEMKRIKQTRKVKNALRIMVEYLEKPINFQVKKRVLDCFNQLKEQRERNNDIFNMYKVNNLVLNTLKDRYNDNVVRK